MSIAQRYLNKIGYVGSLEPTLDLLKVLISLHAEAIPFGNLSCFIGEPISIAPDDIATKLLDSGREGYCLEHSTLTRVALKELGYQTRNLLGRVYYQNTPQATPAKTHLVTVVTLDDKDYLFDPGFGGMTPTGLISFDLGDQPQNTPLESFRLVKSADTGLHPDTLEGIEVMLQSYVRETWINVYGLNPHELVTHSDAVLANWYISTSPQSLFTQQLMVARATFTERTTMNGTTMRTHGMNGSKTQKLESFNDFQKAIEDTMHINTHELDLMRVYERVKG
ncbi:arylamine N-acetyltransferase family protein [Aquirhabdus sp.]|uniref:arylamine N-acetyltransferase family protein n=1 Tax=Aquirhabdus sp. TaxID=2824160 RepID=UPI00396CE310